jgi:hypothetical protein
MKTHRTTEEEMEGPISFWGYKEKETRLILHEHDDNDNDDDDDDDDGEEEEVIKRSVHPVGLSQACVSWRTIQSVQSR